MLIKINVINVLMKKLKKLFCFSYNMLCKWIEDKICFYLGFLLNFYERSESWVFFKRDCF